MATRNGAPWPELREPGQVMDDMDQVFADPSTGVWVYDSYGSSGCMETHRRPSMPARRLATSHAAGSYARSAAA